MTAFASIVAVTFQGHAPDLQEIVMTAHLSNVTQDLAAALDATNGHAAFTALMGPLLPFMQGSESYTHVQTILRDVTPGGSGNVFNDVTDAGVFNSGVGSPMTCALAALMRKHSAFGGRKGRGRLFVPFFPVNMCSINGHMNYSTYGAMEDITDAWSTDFSWTGPEGTYPAANIIWHRGTNTGEIVTSCSFSDLVAIQGRRRIGVGA